jgi:predicted transcriptional regulator
MPKDLTTFQPEGERPAKHRDEASEKIERGLAQFARGEFHSPQETRAELQRKKAEWLRDQKS